MIRNTIKLSLIPTIIVSMLMLSVVPVELINNISKQSTAFVSQEYYEFDETTDFESRVYVGQDIGLIGLPSDISFDETICDVINRISSSWKCDGWQGDYMQNNEFTLDMYLAYQYKMRHWGNLTVEYSTQTNYNGQITTGMTLLDSHENYDVEVKTAFVFEISRIHTPSNSEIQDWRFEIPFPSLLDIDGDGSSIMIGSTEVFLWDQYTSLAMQTGGDVLGSEVELDNYYNLAELNLLNITLQILEDYGGPTTMTAQSTIHALKKVIQVYLTLSLDMSFSVQAAAQTIVSTHTNFNEVQNQYSDENTRKMWGGYLGFSDSRPNDGISVNNVQSNIINAGSSNTALTTLNMLYNVNTQESYSINVEIRPSQEHVSIIGWSIQIGQLAWDFLGLSDPIRIPLVSNMAPTESNHCRNIKVNSRGNIAVPAVPVGDNAVPQVSISGQTIVDTRDMASFDVNYIDADGDRLWYKFSPGDGSVSDWIQISATTTFENNYDTPGVYTASVQVRDPYFASEIATWEIEVLPPPPPSASLNVNQTMPRVGDEVTFVFGAQNFVGDATYHLQFGDDQWHNTSSPGTVVHDYTTKGNKYPSLTVIPSPSSNEEPFRTQIDIKVGSERDPNAVYDSQTNRLQVASDGILLVLDSNNRVASAQNPDPNMNNDSSVNVLNGELALFGAVKSTVQALDWDFDLFIVGDTDLNGEFDTSNQDGPSAGVLQNYQVVIWSTGASYYQTLTDDDQDSLEQYVEGGGRLLLFGQDILYDLYGTGSLSFSSGDFAYDVLGLKNATQDTGVGDELDGQHGINFAEDVFAGTYEIKTRNASNFNGVATNYEDSIYRESSGKYTLNEMTSEISGVEHNHAVINFLNHGQTYEGRTIFFAFDPCVISYRIDLEMLILQATEWSSWSDEDDGTWQEARPLFVGTSSLKMYGTQESTYDVNNPNKDLDWYSLRVSAGYYYRISLTNPASGILYDSDASTNIGTVSSGSYLNIWAEENSNYFLKVTTTTNGGGSYGIDFYQLSDPFSIVASQLQLTVGENSNSSYDSVTPSLPYSTLRLDNYYSTTLYNTDLISGTDYCLTIKLNEAPNGANNYTVIVGNGSDAFVFYSKDGSNIIEGSFTANITGEYLVIISVSGYSNSLFYDGRYSIQLWELPLIQNFNNKSTANNLNQSNGQNGGWLDSDNDQKDWWRFEIFQDEKIAIEFNQDRVQDYQVNVTWTDASDTNTVVQVMSFNGSGNQIFDLPKLDSGIVHLELTSIKYRANYTLGIIEKDEHQIEVGSAILNSLGETGSNDTFTLIAEGGMDLLLRAGPSDKFNQKLLSSTQILVELTDPDGNVYSDIWSLGSGHNLSIQLEDAMHGHWEIKVSGNNGGYWLWIGEDYGLSWTTYPQRYATVEVPFTDQHNAERIFASSLEESVVETWINYQIDQGPSGLTIDKDTGNISFTPQRGQEGSHFVSVMAIDEWNDLLYQNFTLLVSALPNSAPVITSVGSLIFTVGKTTSTTLSATDIDGDNLQWTLLDGPDGLVLQPSGSLSWTPLVTKNENITIQVSDPSNANHVLQLPIVVVNNQPELNQNGQNISLESGEDLKLTLSSTDADQHGVSYTLVSGPNGAFIDSSDVLIWQPQNSQTGIYHDIIISVVDIYGATSTSSLTIYANMPATSSNLPLQDTYSTNSLIQGQVELTDGINASTVLISAPLGVSLGQDGTISWRPSGDQIGNHTIEIGVIWETGEFDIIEIGIKILNTPPAISEFANYASEGKVVVILEVSDVDMHSVSLVCDQDLEIISSTNTEIFKIQWMTNQQDSLALQCTADDGWGGTDQYSTTLTNLNKDGNADGSNTESLSEGSDEGFKGLGLIAVIVISIGALVGGLLIGRIMAGKNV